MIANTDGLPCKVCHSLPDIAALCVRMGSCGIRARRMVISILHVSSYHNAGLAKIFSARKGHATLFPIFAVAPPSFFRKNHRNEFIQKFQIMAALFFSSHSALIYVFNIADHTELPSPSFSRWKIITRALHVAQQRCITSNTDCEIFVIMTKSTQNNQYNRTMLNGF